ncbi:hypothetical protein ANN_07376 [Periplaneta americana]|uniref:Uncharacterized protein n=1 Tax=Periplaneta americana TaxID=6978 RepID=A0ABQ8SYK8_PERAM|nr:hypothetical protein ANN_07376 [Periplaneta americana]
MVEINNLQRIPNLTGEQSDGITVFRIPPMTSLMLHRCRTGSISFQRWWQSPSAAISESDWFLYRAGISRRMTSCTVVSWRYGSTEIPQNFASVAQITTYTVAMTAIDPSSSFVPIPLQRDVIVVHRSDVPFSLPSIIFRLTSKLNTTPDLLLDAIQTDLNKIYNWALKHRMKINGSKSKSITFCKTREETSLNYEFSGVVIPQEQCCKYLGVYLNSKLSWGEHVDNVTGKAWRALHFIMRILRKASPKSREIAYLTLVRPLMEYGTTCWDPYRICQINSLERIQYRAAKFVKGKREDENDTIKELKWETLENRRRKTRITSLYRAHLGQKAWVDITAQLEKPKYYGRNDHDFKIKCRKQKTDVGEIDGVCVCDIPLFKYARLTSCDVERSFSQYKSLFRDNRHAFVMENLEMTFVVHCNSRPTTSTQAWSDLEESLTHRSDLTELIAHRSDLKESLTHRSDLTELIAHRSDLRESLTHRSDLTELIIHRSDLRESLTHRSDLTELIAHRSDLRESLTHRSDLTELIAHRSDLKESLTHRSDLTELIAHRSDLRE